MRAFDDSQSGGAVIHVNVIRLPDGLLNTYVSTDSDPDPVQSFLRECWRSSALDSLNVNENHASKCAFNPHIDLYIYTHMRLCVAISMWSDLAPVSIIHIYFHDRNIIMKYHAKEKDRGTNRDRWVRFRDGWMDGWIDGWIGGATMPYGILYRYSIYTSDAPIVWEVINKLGSLWIYRPGIRILSWR